MSGHSKWANIKHRKAAQDAKRANVFTKLAKDVTIAAREGGDPEMNYRLRLAIDKAKASNMPNENIDRAIKRGTGELKDAAQIEEIVYEAYGPGQIAMLVKVATDKKIRTLSEVRDVLKKNGGKMVEGGSVMWQFENVGIIVAEKGTLGNDEFEEKIIESGANDFRYGDDVYNIYTLPQDLKKVKDNLERNGIKVQEAGLGYVAKNSVEIDENTRIDYEKLLEALDSHDDVSEVYDNIA